LPESECSFELDPRLMRPVFKLPSLKPEISKAEQLELDAKKYVRAKQKELAFEFLNDDNIYRIVDGQIAGEIVCEDNISSTVKSKKYNSQYSAHS
jgi:hypothetical protein